MIIPNSLHSFSCADRPRLRRVRQNSKKTERPTTRYLTLIENAQPTARAQKVSLSAPTAWHEIPRLVAFIESVARGAPGEQAEERPGRDQSLFLKCQVYGAAAVTLRLPIHRQGDFEKPLRPD